MLLRRFVPLVVTIFLASSTISSVQAAFLNDVFASNPAVRDLAKAQTDCRFSVRLDIGKNVKPKQEVKTSNAAGKVERFLLDGLQFDLLQEQPSFGTVVDLPGKNGKLSSGTRGIRVAQEPYFVGRNGVERVQVANGGWELVWRSDLPAGTLNCGFEIPKEVVRNQVKLPACQLYLAFPVFTAEMLAKQQRRKADSARLAREYEEKKNQKLKEMQQTNNLLEKAFLYREASVAYEKQELAAHRYYKWIPDAQEVIPIQQGLVVGSVGTIWTKSSDSFSRLVLIGEAILKPIEESVARDDDNAAGDDAGRPLSNE